MNTLFPDETVHTESHKLVEKISTLKDTYRNMYIIYSETDHQSRLDAWDKCSGLVHWEDPEGSGGEGGGGEDRDGEYT